MSVTVVNDYKLTPDCDKPEVMAAAAELVDYFNTEPTVELSLWLEDKTDPLHHFHITVFTDQTALDRIRTSEAILRFVDRFYPHMDRSTHVAPTCDVWLAAGAGVNPVP